MIIVQVSHFLQKHINAAYLLSSNSTFGHRYGTNRINRQAVTPGSRSYLMGGGISSSEVFPSELSVHTTIAEADMTGHFENFIIFFQDIGHDAFCSCLLYISVLETGCSYLLLPPPMSCHPGNKNETSFSDRFVGFPG